MNRPVIVNVFNHLIIFNQIQFCHVYFHVMIKVYQESKCTTCKNIQYSLPHFQYNFREYNDAIYNVFLSQIVSKHPKLYISVTLRGNYTPWIHAYLFANCVRQGSKCMETYFAGFASEKMLYKP